MPQVDSIVVAVGSVLTVAAIAATTAYAISGAQSQVFGRTIVGPPHPSQLALTFDDGPNPAATPQLLEVLARHHVPATFFLIGDFVLREPTLTREIAAAGHAIGNHTMTHPFLPRRSATRIHDELARCNDAIEATLGRKVELFRPPHGARSPAVFRVAKSLGLKTVQWNLMVDDWKPVPASTILARLERGVERNRAHGQGTNVVLHDGGQAGLGQPRLPTVEAVAGWLDRLASGTVCVTPPDWSERAAR